MHVILKFTLRTDYMSSITSIRKTRFLKIISDPFGLLIINSSAGFAVGLHQRQERDKSFA